MILIENILTLKKHYPGVWEILKSCEEGEQLQRIRILPTKNQTAKTMAVEAGERLLYIHSQYNPEREAEVLWEKYRDVEKYKHVFFYGVGLGHHIESFIKKFPNISFSIYEPDPVILYHYLSYRELKKLPLKLIKNIYTGNILANNRILESNFVNEILNGEVLIVSLPSYERIFAEEYQQFTDRIKSILENKKYDITVNNAFEKRWTVNSMMNLRKTLKTPNILYARENFFRNKPALLVAAGPSLEEEIENIKYIKENKLAYIFSVGSAINTLLEYGIYPDAACTYDPSYENQYVFAKVVEQNISSIPLIYGTSVGFETLEKYPGPKFHMITTQDTLSPYYFKMDEVESLDTVSDAASIAVVTLQLLCKLGFSHIILVGQNLAYKNDRIYAPGIEYDFGSSVVGEKEKREAILVRDVYGNMIESNDGFIRMRQQMEIFIKNSKNVEFVNTTKGGARIEGAPFVELEEVMGRLLTKAVVEDWTNPENYFEYDKDYFEVKCKEMENEYEEFVLIHEDLIHVLKDMDTLSEKGNNEKIVNLFPRLDKLFKKMKSNLFFDLFIRPMNRVSYDLLSKKINDIRFEKDNVKKAKAIIQEFGKFIYQCQQDVLLIRPFLHRIHQMEV